MSGTDVNYLGAFVGGVLSFLAPCVLPLIPGYLSFMTGLSVAEIGSGESAKRSILVPSILFTLGFTTVFVLIGAAAGFASDALRPLMIQYQGILGVVSGVLVILIGVLLLGVIKVPWLYGEARFDMAKSRRFGRAASFAMGLAFGFGWTPCVGPILAVILGMAAQTGDVARSAAMLGVYSLGLAVPFLLTAAFFSRLTGTLAWFNTHSLIISRVAGAILVLMGILMATGQLGRLSALMIELVPFLSKLG
ncbi:MAG: cytochrome c biogenesis protein CcdA [Actinomycetota bacterium]|nr:MAG: cytochrome c-type bioproteinis [Actinomycetota bacterium]MDO8950152.1 cytochrome c biogenesis protein CcdA [Actinomycetota bacterium]MDP3630473.1 cytochrome c biogenesis protein CcdA [Actinomycetota bacterium]